MIPDSSDIIGVEPRYHLRSGYIGFRINGDTENQVSILLSDVTLENPFRFNGSYV